MFRLRYYHRRHSHVIYSLPLRRRTLYYYVSLLLIKKHIFSRALSLPMSALILEYASPIWSPHSTKDIDALEWVHCRFTKSFSNILLTSLYVCRNHIDLITCFRLIQGLTHLLHSLPRRNSVTRGHPYTLIKTPSKFNFHFFSRTVDCNLSLSTVTASSLPTFKFKLTSPPIS